MAREIEHEQPERDGPLRVRSPRVGGFGLAGLCLGLTLTAACGGPGESISDETAHDAQSTETSTARADLNPLFVDPSTRDFSENPELLRRILADPHGYFRFINLTFSQEICERFAHLLAGRPTFNLHGDAHIEQYAVTDLGRGMTDYDDSSVGPAVIDLARFGVSLSLTARLNGWEDQADQVYADFLRGYRDALEDPDLDNPPPAVARRMAKGFKDDPAAYYSWVESLMQPVPKDEAARLVAAMEPYAEVTLAEDPGLDSRFFEPLQVGYLRAGIGSALDLKYLVRTRGPSADPLDDVVLEIKQVRDLRGIDCISVARGDDPFRILVGQARIANQPYLYLGYLRIEEQNFWVHAWVENFKEVDVHATFQSVEELSELAYDVGIQLGRGHINQIAAPLDEQLRREQIRIIDRRQELIQETVRELTRSTLDAWELFRSAAAEISGAEETS